MIIKRTRCVLGHLVLQGATTAPDGEKMQDSSMIKVAGKTGGLERHVVGPVTDNRYAIERLF